MDTDIHTQRGNLQSSITSPEVADLIVAYLGQIGVEYLFGIPGGAIEPLYDALARGSRRGGPKPIIACHEAGAAFMADGYARETGKLGVCCASSGPATTNLITGVACAYENGVPMLVLTGQPRLAVFGKHAMQESAYLEIDTLSMFRHCSRYNTLVSHAQQVEAKLVNALHNALQAPRGPVHLGFPADILRCKIASAIPSYNLSSLLKPSSAVDEYALDLLVKAIQGANSIVLLIGGWCVEAIGSILQFATLQGAAFVTTQDGKALVNPRHPLYRGVFGHGGQSSADAALQDPSVDLIVAVGFRMSEQTGNGSSTSFLNGRLVHIDESEEHLERTPMARFHVRGRILTIFQLLTERLCNGAEDHRMLSRADRIVAAGLHSQPVDPEPAASDATSITPQRLMLDLSRRFPPATRYLADSGNCLAWATHYLQPDDRRVADRRLGSSGRKESVDRRGKDGGRLAGGRLRSAMGFAPMGYAIGAAVGTAAGNPGTPVVCITDADSMRMNGQEISVAVAARLTIIYVVLNEVALRSFNSTSTVSVGENHSCRPAATDFAAFARALGADAGIIKTPQDLQAIDFDALCRRNGPTLLDVYIAPDEIPRIRLGESEGPAIAEQ